MPWRKGQVHGQTMTDKDVNIEVPTSRLTLEEVVGPQFEKMDIARLYRVAEGEMIKFTNFPSPELRLSFA